MNAGILCASLALNSIEVPGGDGIISSDVEKTIRDLGYLVHKGMASTDDIVINIQTGL